MNNWSAKASIRPCDILNLAQETWHHFKVEINSSNIIISNTTNSNTQSFNNDSVNRIAFSGNDMGDILRFKNFIIYSQ